MTHSPHITIIGAGLAGSEAAWQSAKLGVPVTLYEMRPLKFSPAHATPYFAELVCSNSLRSAALNSAAGLLKEELRVCGSLIMEAAYASAVPAGKALAVDRGIFSEFVHNRVSTHPLIEVRIAEITELPGPEGGVVIVAGGPLVSDALAGDITRKLGAAGLNFYDAIAPIVSADSLDMSKLFRASRYDEDGEGDYLNAPFDREAYYRFVEAVQEARKVEPHPFEKIPHFEGCLPIEALAERGPDTLAFGPMKPVGLIDPATGRRPFAVVQLRAENAEKSLFNLVGFQTKMAYPEQERIFRTIPGLERAEFIRLGSAHRNTYLNSPELLDEWCAASAMPHVYFAGQITGVEGYLESTASGLATAIGAAFRTMGKEIPVPSGETAVGALLRHTHTKPAKRFEPMNINFGIIDSAPEGVHKRERKTAVVARALTRIREWRALVDERSPQS